MIGPVIENSQLAYNVNTELMQSNLVETCYIGGVY